MAEKTVDKLRKTDEEWRKQLTDHQYKVMRKHGTERAFSGIYWDHHDKGTYTVRVLRRSRSSAPSTSSTRAPAGRATGSPTSPAAVETPGGLELLHEAHRGALRALRRPSRPRLRRRPGADRPALLHQLGVAQVREEVGTAGQAAGFAGVPVRLPAGGPAATSCNNAARMKFLFDLFPVILFFVAFKLADIYVATGVAIAATFAQIGWLQAARAQGRDDAVGRASRSSWCSAARRCALHDETFIKWKPTVLYWLFAAVLAGGELLLPPQPDPHDARRAARRCPTRPGASSTGAGSRSSPSWASANLYVAFNFSTDTWVNFKLFGGMGLMLVFVLGQGLFLAQVRGREGHDRRSRVADPRAARRARARGARTRRRERAARRSRRRRAAAAATTACMIVSPHFRGQGTVDAPSHGVRRARSDDAAGRSTR